MCRDTKEPYESGQPVGSQGSVGSLGVGCRCVATCLASTQAVAHSNWIGLLVIKDKIDI